MAAPKTKPRKNLAKSPAAANGVPEPADVMTLAEAAAYLRVSEENIVRMVHDQDLPGRFVADGWRFLGSALREWLAKPMPKQSNEAMLSIIGSMKDDPYVDEMLAEIYKQRGRPMIEEKE